MFDNNVIKTLKNNKISYSRCMRENLNSEPLKESVQRIITPIYHMSEMLGIVVILSRQKRGLNEELDILEGKSPKDHLLDVLQKAHKLAEEHQKSKKFNNATKSALKAVYNSTKRAVELLSKESDDEI